MSAKSLSLNNQDMCASCSFNMERHKKAGSAHNSNNWYMCSPLRLPSHFTCMSFLCASHFIIWNIKKISTQRSRFNKVNFYCFFKWNWHVCVVNTITMTSTAWRHCLEWAQLTVVSLPAALTPMWRPTQGKMEMECLCVVIKIVLRPSVPGKSQEASRKLHFTFQEPVC